MSRYDRQHLRPLGYIALSLLAGTILAPFNWEALSLAPKLASREETGVDSKDEDSPEPRSILRRSQPNQPPETKGRTQVAVVLPQVDWTLQPQPLSGRTPPELEQFAVSPVVAEPAPAVTELIRLDPSLAESPEVPALTSSSSSNPRPAETPVDPVDPPDLDTPLPTKPLVRTPQVVPPIMRGAWPFPQSLAEQLHALETEVPDAKDWADRVEAEITALSMCDSLTGSAVEEHLFKLRDLVEEVRQYSAPQVATRERTLRLRAAYAVVRRLVVWETVACIAASDQATVQPQLFDHAAFQDEIQSIDQLLSGVPACNAWGVYLRLADLKRLVGHEGVLNSDERAFARDVLRRLDSPRLDHSQYHFLQSDPFERLRQTLTASVAESIDWGTLIDGLEKHESSATSTDAGRVADAYQRLRWLPGDTHKKLSVAVNNTYRNANVRVAISEELINRFVPGPTAMNEPVMDNIRGADVFGHSQAITRLRIVLLPDQLRWRMGLEARGSVSSATESVKGPARFWNDGFGEFKAQKLLTVDRRGLRTASAAAQANADSHLKDFETDFDHIPLLNMFVRSIAQRQYDNEQPAARFEIEERISSRASARLNDEVDKQLAQAQREFQTKFLDPLDRLNLEPTPVDMETTARRVVARYRMAGPHQLSAHTPRPQAPGNSLLSLQFHESLMNNTLENLKLDNRRIDLRELYVEMLRRFEAKDLQIPDDLPEEVTVHFAEVDPVRITAENGRVCLAIRLQELNHADTNTWKNFEVRAYYKPSENQQEANLVRDGVIELSGERLRLGDQVALRGIFAKVLSRNRTLAIVNRQLLLRKELHDLQVTQFIIQDGWIGIAIGPQVGPLPPATSEPQVELSNRPLRQIFPGLR